ncbi:family 43 glycosylhydrolase [Alloscardovia omnicolens]|uniref:glycoside hydrolase family 43 protein n=1 Tax=Alloscardovia omnicolens TaxID=419015 RepID=UPI003A64801D
MATYNNPLVLQRADPWVIKHKGTYYFTGSYPAYDRIILRQAKTLNDLQNAEEKAIWFKHDQGVMSKYIWAPELHRIGNAWYIYFAAAEREFEESGLPTHRMYVLENLSDDPMEGQWVEKGQIVTPIDSFSLDATSTVIDGVQYLIWAQKDPQIEGNSNLYIAQMSNPWTLATEPVMLSKPEYDWECIDFLVNEGPAVLFHDDDIFIAYSASGTGVPYAVGLLRAKVGSDLLDPSSWNKSDKPVFATCEENNQYGPGHNSFTVSEDDSEDVMVYHARNYTQIEGDPLFDPNRHARAGVITWENGKPIFGVPDKDVRWTPQSTDILPPQGRE